MKAVFLFAVPGSGRRVRRRGAAPATPDIEWVTGRPAHNLRRWVLDHAAAF
jgi:hypothetical protein